MRTRRTSAVLSALLAGLVMGAPAAEAATVKTVSMTTAKTFSPKTVTVARGTLVRWTNPRSLLGSTHTTTSMTGLWDSKSVQQGTSFSRTFSKAGTFRYRCTLHSNAAGTTGMTGTVVVR